jgi:hypothetical protein
LDSLLEDSQRIPNTARHKPSPQGRRILSASNLVRSSSQSAQPAIVRRPVTGRPAVVQGPKANPFQVHPFKSTTKDNRGVGGNRKYTRKRNDKKVYNNPKKTRRRNIQPVSSNKNKHTRKRSRT